MRTILKVISLITLSLMVWLGVVWVRDERHSSQEFMALAATFGRPEHSTQLTAGTGFFISPAGYVLTADHTVQQCLEIKVRTRNGRVFKASLYAHDPRPDLAVLRLQSNSEFPYVDFSEQAEVGEKVYALGYSGRSDSIQLSTLGSVIPRRYAFDDGLVWFHAGHVPHGFSGGPLVVARNSHVVGIVRAYGDDAVDAAVLGHQVGDGMGLDALMYGDFLRRKKIQLPTGPQPPISDPRAALVRVVCFVK